jgi:Mg2+ and Co2+ transporter CorA
MTRPEFDWELPQAISNRLGTESYGAQRAIHEANHLLVVLHEPPAKDSNEREHAVFLRKPDGQWLYKGSNDGAFAFDRLLDQYEAVLSAIEGRFSKAQTAEDLFQVLDRLIPVARSATNMKAALQSAREAVKEDRLLIDLRDRSIEVARGLELLLADARLALDFRLARNAEEQTQAAMAANRAQQKLNVLAALTFPLMTLTAVFGMNLRSGAEEFSIIAFWAIFLAGIVLGLMVRSWVQTKLPAQPAKTVTKSKSKP